MGRDTSCPAWYSRHVVPAPPLRANSCSVIALHISLPPIHVQRIAALMLAPSCMVGLGPSCTWATAALIEIKPSSGLGLEVPCCCWHLRAPEPGGGVRQQTNVSFPDAAQSVQVVHLCTAGK